jgi:hypothetical protein
VSQRVYKKSYLKKDTSNTKKDQKDIKKRNPNRNQKRYWKEILKRDIKYITTDLKSYVKYKIEHNANFEIENAKINKL